MTFMKLETTLWFLLSNQRKKGLSSTSYGAIDGSTSYKLLFSVLGVQNFKLETTSLRALITKNLEKVNSPRHTWTSPW